MARTYYSINDIFDLFSKDFDEAFSAVQSSNVFSGSFPPYDVEINEETKDLRFRFALAGYKEKDIEISFDGDYMFLEILSPEKKDDKSFKTVQHGIKSSSARLKVAVPSARYDRDIAEAFFEDGILTVFIPRKEEEKPKKIKIIPRKETKMLN